MTAPAKPIFVLGVGAQKAGTSWLNYQINKNSAVNVGFSKEYHVWTPLLYRKPLPFGRVKDGPETAKDGLLRLMRTHGGAYEAYFQGLIHANVRYTADFSPSYAGLRREDFAEIKARLERAGFQVKVVFIMRDPAERNWSAMQMFRRDGTVFGDGVAPNDLVENFEEFFMRRDMAIRTRYGNLVRTLREVFDADDLFFGIYEAMFNNEFIAEFSDFLGLKLEEIDIDEKINSYDSVPLPLEQYNLCREYYANVYKFCASNFPITEKLWQWAEGT